MSQTILLFLFHTDVYKHIQCVNTDNIITQIHILITSHKRKLGNEESIIKYIHISGCGHCRVLHFTVSGGFTIPFLEKASFRAGELSPAK